MAFKSARPVIQKSHVHWLNQTILVDPTAQQSVLPFALIFALSCAEPRLWGWSVASLLAFSYSISHIIKALQVSNHCIMTLLRAGGSSNITLEVPLTLNCPGATNVPFAIKIAP